MTTDPALTTGIAPPGVGDQDLLDRVGGADVDSRGYLLSPT
jgi:hypothetical protein